MPLTEKGKSILKSMEKEYGPRAKQVLYASKNKGTITGIDSADWMDAFTDEDVNYACDALAREDAEHWERSASDKVKVVRIPAGGFEISTSDGKSFRAKTATERESIIDREKKRLEGRGDAFSSKLDALCDAAQNLESRVDMRLDDHRVLGGVGFTPPSGGVRGDAVKRLERFSLSDLQKGLSDLENELSDAITAGHNYRAGNLRRDIDDLKSEIASRK